MPEASKIQSAEQWAIQEFSGARLPGQRLVKRLIQIGTDFAQAPAASLPEAGGSSNAAYRFFDQKDKKLT